MRFTGEKAAFGRHETFPLRFGWLTKGAQALMSGEPVFEAEDATVGLGAGESMVSSIRYWLQAALQVLERAQADLAGRFRAIHVGGNGHCPILLTGSPEPPGRKLTWALV